MTGMMGTSVNVDKTGPKIAQQTNILDQPLFSVVSF